MRNAIFSLLLAVISRLLIRIDVRTGAFKRALSLFKFENERITITSGHRRLAAVFDSRRRRSDRSNLSWHRRDSPTRDRCSACCSRWASLSSGLQLLRLRQKHRHPQRRALRRRRNRSL